MEFNKSQVKVVVVLILLLFALLIIQPFIITLIFSAIVAYLVYPVHTKLKKRVGDRISATIITLSIFLFIIFCLYYGINLLLTEITNFYVFISKINISQFSPTFKEFAQVITSKIIVLISDQITTVINVIISFTVFIVSLFYFIKEGDSIHASLAKYIPFDSERTKRLFDEIKNTINSYVYVQILIGIIQGIVAGIGFYLFGLPYALIGAIAVGILSILPIIGTYGAYIPISLLAYQLIGIDAAVGILMYGLILGSILDYIVRPLMYGKKIKLHPLITFLGIFGGIMMFGLVGIILGPILLSISISLIKEMRIKNG